MSMQGYRLSRQAGATARHWDASRGGNIVRFPAKQAGAGEERMITGVDVFGDGFLERPGSSIQSLQVLGMSAADIAVTTETALRVPAVSAAVNFIASTLASLPLDLYRRTRDRGRVEETGALARLLHDAPNEYLTSFEWRRGMLTGKLTGGRGFSYIERDSGGRVLNIWPMDPRATTVRRENFRLVYDYRDGFRMKTYRADEVIDLPHMLAGDGLKHYGPIQLGADAIGLAIALTQYGSRFFAGGGVPPFAVEGNFQSGAGMQRAADDLAAAVRKAAAENRQALVMPAGHKITPIGGDPEKAQMVEMQRFCIEQIARLYSLPMVFLQDLTDGTYSNTEQQDLHFVKHTLLHHVRQFEQELNLKLFGRGRGSLYVEFNVDGLLRGDFKTRMEGWARAIQTGIVMPNEARASENWPAAEGGDQLFMQGATVPIGMAAAQTTSGIDPASAQGAQSPDGGQL